MTLTCDVRHCEASLDMAATTQLLRVPELCVKLKLDESWEIGCPSPREDKAREEREQHCELERLRKENTELREQLARRKH